MTRIIILIASVLIQTCIGGLYAWSEFVTKLTETYDLSTAQTQLIFGTLIAVFTVSMVGAGRLLGRIGPRWVAMGGGLAFGGGYLIASRSGGEFWVLLLGIGVISGIGTGFCYVCPLTMCAKWFPDRKGLVTGIAVAGFGGGAVVLSTFAEYYFETGHGVLEVFEKIGLVYGVVIVLASLPLKMPDGAASSTVHIEFDVLRRDRYFWGLALGMFAGTFAGLLVIGNLKPMIVEGGVSSHAATAAISAFAIGNAFGRISWGWITDRLGVLAVPVSLAFLAVMILLSWLVMGTAVGAIAVSALLGAGFGACFVVYAAQTASHFGSDHLASIYPLVFLAYGVSGLAGPYVGGTIYDHFQSYSGGLGLSLLILLTAIAGCHLLLGPFKVRK